MQIETSRRIIIICINNFGQKYIFPRWDERVYISLVEFKIGFWYDYFKNETHNGYKLMSSTL